MPRCKDPAVFMGEISTSSKKSKHDCCCCYYYSYEQYGGLSPTFQLPEEILYEVFLRLPVKSLIRFRCVSKGMRRLIDSPIFINNHNIRRRCVIISERDREYAICFHQPRSQRLFSVIFDEEEDNNNNLIRAKAIERYSGFLKEMSEEFMFRSATLFKKVKKEVRTEGEGWCCNGIFCFKLSRTYVFWNPSNGTFRIVDRTTCLNSYNVSMGYDYVNDDYKIISIVPIKDETSLEVYSFRNNSWRTWKYRDFPKGTLDCYPGVACVSGVMHWIREDGTDLSIAAFDLATETFTLLQLPLEPRQLQLIPHHVTDFGGRLCLTFCPQGYPSRMVGTQTIWVMEKYGVESSWTKLYNFDQSPMVKTFYFPNCKRRLLCCYEWLSWWDPQDGSSEDIEIPGLLNGPSKLYNYRAYIYVRNLVRLDKRWEPR